MPDSNAHDTINLTGLINTVSTIVTAIASLLLLYFQIYPGAAKLPEWFTYFLLCLFVLGILIVFVYQLVRLRNRWKSNALARKKFAQLRILVDDFQILTSPQQVDTITSALGLIRKPENDLQKREFLDLCAWMTGNLVIRLQGSNHDFISMKLAIQDLRVLVHSYHRVYFIEGIKTLRTMAADAADEEGKRTIEVARESFARYLEKYQQFCKEINEALGEKMFDFYFEKAKPL